MRSILIVEDNLLTVSLIKDICVYSGFKVLVAQTCTEAKRILKNKKNFFTVIFMDMNLPDGIGFDLAIEIKKMKRYKRVLMILLTGESFIDSQYSKIQTVFSCIMQKPIDVSQVITFLTHIK